MLILCRVLRLDIFFLSKFRLNICDGIGSRETCVFIRLSLHENIKCIFDYGNFSMCTKSDEYIA